MLLKPSIMNAHIYRILTVNSGSSCIKFSLYEMGQRELNRLSGQAERMGERAPTIRWRICDSLAFMDVHLDVTRNQASTPVISCESSPVTVRVMKTNEELVIARHTYQILRKEERSKKREIVQ
jgi:acetate kinase